VARRLSKEKKDVLIIAGGIIPDEDRGHLKEKGIKGIFGPGAKLKGIVDFIRSNIKSCQS